VDKKDVKKMDVFIQYAIAAAAVRDGRLRLQITPANATSVGVFIGSGIGGFATIEREHQTLLESGPAASRPSSSPR
jgi:3-oxoacyl-[acyl-carrier-protein] synthase II